MNIKWLSLIVAISNFSVMVMAVYAGTPPKYIDPAYSPRRPISLSCFESKFDYEIYLRYGELSPLSPLAAAVGKLTNEELEWAMDAMKHGPARKKKINITFKQSQESSTSKILLDASSSTTPSGEIGFAWIYDKRAVSTSAEYLRSDGPAGSSAKITLGVEDPVCRFIEYKDITVTSK